MTAAIAPTAPAADRSRLYAAYGGTAAVWGSSFLFIEIGLRALSPVQVALARLLLGLVALGLYLAIRRIPLPRDPRVWLHLSVMGLVFCTLPFILFPWAQTRLTSGLASVYNATTPLWTLLLVSVFARVEPVTRARLLGIGVGFAGVCVIFAPALLEPGSAPPAAHLACLGATLCYGVSLTWLRRFVLPLGLPVEVIAIGQVATGTVVAGLVVLVAGRSPVALSWQVVAAMVALGALGTGLAYVWNTAVARGFGVTAASTVTYLTPVVGVLLGVLLLGETVQWYEVVGGVVILLGIAIGQGLLSPARLRRPPRARPAARSGVAPRP